jgi:hypothetical protein
MWVEKLEVSDVAEGAANVNVQGRREVSALQGFGKLWQKTYRGAFGQGRINAGLGREGLEGALPRIPAAEQPVLPVDGGRRAPGNLSSSAPPWEACRCIRVSA